MTATRGLALTVAVLWLGSVAFPALAADHGDAPLLASDANSDIADVFGFISPSDPSMLVLIMTVNPLSAPAESTIYHFSTDVSYEFLLDNDGDSIADHRIEFVFDTRTPGNQLFRASLPDGIVMVGRATPPTQEPDPNEPIIVEGPGGSLAFAGPVDDPFFFDQVGFSRLLAGTGSFSGIDGLAGFNVSAIAAEIPLSWVAGPTGGALNLWATTSRRRLTIRDTDQGLLPRDRGPFRQIERMGNPLVGRVFVPAELRDLYNINEPVNDVDEFSGAVVSTLMDLGTTSANIETLLAIIMPDTLELDPTDPTGYPNGRRLEDDVIDTILFLVFNGSGVTDGVDSNDEPFSDTFPYLAAPHQPE